MLRLYKRSRNRSMSCESPSTRTGYPDTWGTASSSSIARHCSAYNAAILSHSLFVMPTSRGTPRRRTSYPRASAMTNPTTPRPPFVAPPSKATWMNGPGWKTLQRGTLAGVVMRCSNSGSTYSSSSMPHTLAGSQSTTTSSSTLTTNWPPYDSMSHSLQTRSGLICS